MAIGISGSNGGVGKSQKEFKDNFLLNRPLEVSYFINNICNLKCRHCYVGYDNPNGELSIDEWTKVFDELIDLGALTFGNVGKEPLLNWEKTKTLLQYFNEKKEDNEKIRFGFVTNGILFNEQIIKELSDIKPDYIDISIDGNKKAHDFIRGKGSYDKILNNLKLFKDNSLLDNIFISYTLMQPNKSLIKETIQNSQDIGINHFLISAYVKSNGEYNLEIKNEDISEVYNKIINDKEINFNKTKNLEILLKSDYDTQKPLIDLLVEQKIIDVNNLLIDEHGVIFNKYDKENNSKIIVNYIPFPETLSRTIRISHDGYVSGCQEMFFSDYQKRVKGNVKEKNIQDILLN